MIPKTLLNKDLSTLLNACDVFKKGDFEFSGHFKTNAQVLYDDNSIGYQTTLLILKEDGNQLRLRDTITEIASSQNYQIIQIADESKVLNRLVLKETYSNPIPMPNNEIL
ncbi:hypothetical protein BKH41_02995 [Helicobacter sp. 12S02232-10]|uniref:hypothetical protein n=1 Tax=Helicobacter sp. 12S02232-10 TaxID=1476197 RepID=UPI000BA72717|nr:hypothetical protein [Helicobacter sp. 12S02232-10]PAF49073.1 hypothetical protein BKH41_02995 [Helicobacter sp. 12S02232-10]